MQLVDLVLFLSPAPFSSFCFVVKEIKKTVSFFLFVSSRPYVFARWHLLVQWNES